MEKIKAGRENKPHIGIFGRCNAGKSTLMNFITGTDAAIVSPAEGTTTDPVRRGYEIPGFSPVIFIDTGGIDDRSALAARRRERTYETLSQIDLAIVVFNKWERPEEDLVHELDAAAVPYIMVQNRIGDSAEGPGKEFLSLDLHDPAGGDHTRLIDLIKGNVPAEALRPGAMLTGQVDPGDSVILVCPIDSEAPAGRMILPQMQTVRELLDNRALAVTVQPGELGLALEKVPAPRMVITDSQVYREVRAQVPAHVEVTTFSILLAGAKGDMQVYGRGLGAVDRLRDGDRVLITENCLHQVSCEDIGRVKIPAWMESYTGKRLRFEFVSGLSPLPTDLDSYALIVQCGGCMATRSQLRNRIRQAVASNVPITNYGMLIRKIRG